MLSVNQIKKQKARQFAHDGLLRLDHIEKIFGWSKSNARAKLNLFEMPPRESNHRIEIYLNSVEKVIDQMYPEDQ